MGGIANLPGENMAAQFSPRLSACFPQDHEQRDTVVAFLARLHLRSCLIVATYFDSPEDFASELAKEYNDSCRVSAAEFFARVEQTSSAAVHGAARADVAAGARPWGPSRVAEYVQTPERPAQLSQSSYPERLTLKRARKRTAEQQVSHQSQERQELENAVERALALADQLKDIAPRMNSFSRQGM